MVGILVSQIPQKHCPWVVSLLLDEQNIYDRHDDLKNINNSHSSFYKTAKQCSHTIVELSNIRELSSSLSVSLSALLVHEMRFLILP